MSPGPVSPKLARQLFGVSGRAEYAPLRDAMIGARLGPRPALALAALAGVHALWLPALVLLAPRISLTLGASVSLTVLLVVLLGTLVGSGVAVQRLLDAGRSRRRWAVWAGAAALIALASTGLQDNIWELIGCAAVSGTAGGVAWAVQPPLLADHYLPEVRVRLFIVYAGVALGSSAAVAAVVAACQVSGLTWRASFLLLAALGLGAVVSAGGLEDRPAGYWDSARLAALIGAAGNGGGGGTDETVETGGAGYGERIRQVVAAPAARSVLTAVAVWGAAFFGLRPFLIVSWQDRWSLDLAGQALTSAGCFLGAAAALALLGRRSEVAWRLGPDQLLLVGRRAGWTGGALLAASPFVPTAALSVLATAAGLGALTLWPAAALVHLVATTAPRWRPAASLLVGASALAGATVGNQVLSSIGARFGAGAAVLASGVTALAAAQGLRSAAPAAAPALDAAIARLVEAGEARLAAAGGSPLPLLACTGIDFSYGPLQVLYEVDFKVEEGEMVALLGTNGAGKSTLLRVISGLGYPSRGTVRCRGVDITHLGPRRRVALGIAQVPGGRAVFGPMTVLDNLRVFAFSEGRDQRRVEAGIDATFAAFPRLEERRHQLAATLSGGEQQMLALAKAFILEPRLLLIDELSLGLAPVVVAELLEMVRRINGRGAAVVLVEQSVNVALSLVEHAYFMEKGQVRFDGRASELVERPDLLRSVFLEGAARAAAR